VISKKPGARAYIVHHAEQRPGTNQTENFRTVRINTHISGQAVCLAFFVTAFLSGQHDVTPSDIA
jgi:hypothetical protein